MVTTSKIYGRYLVKRFELGIGYRSRLEIPLISYQVQRWICSWARVMQFCKEDDSAVIKVFQGIDLPGVNTPKVEK